MLRNLGDTAYAAAWRTGSVERGCAPRRGGLPYTVQHTPKPQHPHTLRQLRPRPTPALDVLGMAEEAGHPDRVFLFASTSKITFAGAGVSFFASSKANVAWYLGHLGKRTIGPDKVNHLRHVRLLQSPDGVRELMRAHRAIIAPKFALVDQILTDRLGDGFSAVYSFFAPELDRQSLGTYAILWLIKRARAEGLPYVYLGYWVAESRKMAYKARFRPCEILVGGTWRVLTDRELTRPEAVSAELISEPTS